MLGASREPGRPQCRPSTHPCRDHALQTKGTLCLSAVHTVRRLRLRYAGACALCETELPKAARRERFRAERAASTDPLADFAGPLVYDGYLDAFRPANLFSGDPLDLEAIAVWEEENGVPWDSDSEEPLTAAPAPRTPRSLSTEHPRCRLCRKVRHHYAASADGLLRVCLGCAAGLPLAQLTAADAAAELIAQRGPAHRRDFVLRLRARFPELPWDTGIVREGRQRRHVRRPHRTRLPARS
jgi:hypothetical protein